jgi:hypothetical protein
MMNLLVFVNKIAKKNLHLNNSCSFHDQGKSSALLVEHGETNDSQVRQIKRIRKEYWRKEGWR